MIFRFLSKIERLCAKYQGKGWGAFTVAQEVDNVAKFVKNPALAIDIGSNIGEYTAKLKDKFSGIEIHLFEPSSLNYDKLIHRFKGDDKVIVNKLAISNENGVSELFSNFEGSGLSSLTKRRLGHIGVDFNVSEKIETIRFEQYWESNLDERVIDFIKLDVEGHELNALNSFGKSIFKTKAIQFEFGGCNIDTKTYFQDFWYFFKEHPFKIYRMTPIGPQPITYYRELDETFVNTNFLCINHNLNSI